MKSLYLNEPGEEVNFGWKSVALSSLLPLALTHNLIFFYLSINLFLNMDE